MNRTSSVPVVGQYGAHIAWKFIHVGVVGALLILASGCRSAVSIQGGQGGEGGQGAQGAQGGQGGQGVQVTAGGGEDNGCRDCPPASRCNDDSDCDHSCSSEKETMQFFVQCKGIFPCAVDDDCASFPVQPGSPGAYCNGHSLAVAHCREMCTQGEQCLDNENCAAGRCEVTTCSSDDNCESFSRCEEHICVARNCTTNADCGEGVCVNSECASSFGYCDILC